MKVEYRVSKRKHNIIDHIHHLERDSYILKVEFFLCEFELVKLQTDNESGI